MSSMMETKLTPEQHALLGRVLSAQTEAFGWVELPIVTDLLERQRCANVLDIGCGDGEFLRRLARQLPSTTFVGVDHSELAIADANRALESEPLPNLSFRAAFFDSSFDTRPHDGIVTRYTVQHASDPEGFVHAVFARLRHNGVFVALESLDAYTDCRRREPVWERFKSALAAVHEGVGSDANVGKSLGWLLRGAGFVDVRVRVMLCGPSVVGWERFRDVVQASAELAFAFFPRLFDRALLEDVTAWLADRVRIEEADPYLCSAVASGVRPAAAGSARAK